MRFRLLTARPALAARLALALSATSLVSTSPTLAAGPSSETTPVIPAFDAVPLEGQPRTARPYFPGPLGTLGTLELANIQSECTVAASGSQVVIGFNDFRVSGNFSGVLYSTDGGTTFTDFGQLPTAGGTTAVNGDPVVAVYNPPIGPPTFYYASLYRNALGQNSLCVHKSTDGGASWSGPFEVTSASSADFADKEWLTVDPETGRIHISWSSFGATVTIRTTHSDDGGLTWSPAVTLSSPNSVQGSSIAADPNGPNVYAAWRRIVATGPTQARINFSRSTDNGVTWSAEADVTPTFFHVVPPYGFDRFNSFPSIAVNPVDGGIELVYAASATGQPTGDFGDILYSRSTDAGLTWSPALRLNADVGAGAGRPQCFPSVSCDPSGRIDVVWYDESIGEGVSDLTDLFTTYSADFGATWSSPVAANPKPFPNESGNNFSAPHQGDYLQAFSAGGVSYAGFAFMVDPLPTGSGADAMVSVNAPPLDRPSLRVRPGSAGITDSGCLANDGRLVAGETGLLDIPVENYGTVGYAGIQATLSSLTAGVTADGTPRNYPNLDPGDTGLQDVPFSIALDPAYPCGTPLRLRLTLTAAGNDPNFVEFTLPTGVFAIGSLLLDESFDGVAAPALPAGWTSSVQGGTNTPWVTTTTTPATPPNAAFIPDPAVMTFMQLEGPSVAIPAGTTFVELHFDTRYTMEQQDARNAFDAGSFGYQLDGLGGTHFASADAIEFDHRYTHYVVRSSGGSRGDRSGYSGVQPDYAHVRIRIPGLAGHTIKPRWHFTADAADAAVGWWVDNVQVLGITMDCGTCTPVAVGPGGPVPFGLLGVRPNPMRGSGAVEFGLPRPLPVYAEVISVDGRLVRTLSRGQLFGPGRNRLDWDGRDGSGRAVPAGVYWVALRSAEGVARARVVVLH